MSTPGDYDAVRTDIKAIIPNSNWDDGSLGPLFVRLAWHASGTFDKYSCTGGSGGATMRFSIEANDPANAGLEHARAFLEPIKQKHPWISYADLWTLSGVVSVEHMGGPVVPWKPGRKDVVDEKKVPPNGRLPDASQGEQHIRHVFNRMGFDDRQIVALIGAHSLGRCHGDRSGYEGPWTITPIRFTNLFFIHLLKEDWTEKIVNNQVQYKDGRDRLMMLPTDLALRNDEKFKEIVEIYAKNKGEFFNDFAEAFGKLLELGVDRSDDLLN
ncbi:hypothetical protein Glove_22g67 [Diversispora epigaea]|uniref:Peroxidase n=1 Tax=Diversispora epigaea TaxID=1348612 RepID=A0A397JKH2_9GLOM|nr:hypothetical protein Glove_22g67 [Diversispora epigaea]